MKKILLTCLSFLFVTAIFAQLPVSTDPENKNVVLEEFTGIHCQFCPDGHKVANELAEANPGDVFLINIHAGGYAVPNEGEPDFRTEFGEAIDDQSNLAGYPAGTVNRHVFDGMEMNPGGTAMSRSYWDDATDIILGESSYVNVALEADLNVVSRELVVDVEMYFTGTAPASVNLNVVLTQDNIEGPQIGAETWYPEQILPNGNYVHNHMLRHMLTGQWGEEITTTDQGTTVAKQYTYTLPNDINDVELFIGNLNIIAFVAEGQQEIITGNKGPITYTGLLDINAGLTGIDIHNVICETSLFPLITMRNDGSDTLTSAEITIDFDGEGATVYNWTGSLATFESVEFRIPEITAPDEGGTLNLTITAANGVEDTDVSNNVLTKLIEKTPYVGTGLNYVMTVVQDQYGSETTWSITTSGGQTVASGGPYSDLGGLGTAEHTVEFEMPSEGCFDFVIEDAYGDGINSGYGEGSYKLENSVGTIVFEGDGVFGSSERIPFEILTLASPENDILSFTFNETEETDSIFADEKLIKVSLPASVDITALVAEFTLSDLAGAMVNDVEQVSGETANDFTDTVFYHITSESQEVAIWTVVVSQFVSTERVTKKELSLYPNPTYGSIFVENVQRGSYKIYDFMGRIVFEENILENKEEINLSNLNEGNYIIKITDNENVYINQFTIIK